MSVNVDKEFTQGHLRNETTAVAVPGLCCLVCRPVDLGSLALVATLRRRHVTLGALSSLAVLWIIVVLNGPN